MRTPAPAPSSASCCSASRSAASTLKDAAPEKTFRGARAPAAAASPRAFDSFCVFSWAMAARSSFSFASQRRRLWWSASHRPELDASAGAPPPSLSYS